MFMVFTRHYRQLYNIAHIATGDQSLVYCIKFYVVAMETESHCFLICNLETWSQMFDHPGVDNKSFSNLK